MTEEIKEILDNQKLINVENDYERIIFEYLANNCSEFDDEHIKQLVNLKVEQYKQSLDYITNLQQEKEKLKQTLHNITINGVEEENTTVLDLINENKKLKECYCNRTDCSGRLKDSKKYDSVYQEKEDYKSRCEKAIELLKSTIIENSWFKQFKEKQLNILNGSGANATK